MDAKTEGFRNSSRRHIEGVGFTSLLRRVAEAAPNVRFRFTSPHPKDFPMDLLELIRDTPNICSQIHLPAQSGSSAVLERMRRGYTREAYLNLVERVREVIPNVAISTDIIAGFCGETKQDHDETVSLMKQVQYDQAFMYMYSQREKTYAHRKFADDVSDEDKGERLREIVSTFREGLTAKNLTEVEPTDARFTTPSSVIPVARLFPTSAS